MNKKLVMIIVSIVLLIAVVIAYVVISQKKDTSTDSNKPSIDTSQNNSPSEIPTSGEQRNGLYVEYSDTIIANTSGTKVLFFHAPWCPQCREMEKSIQQDGIPKGVTVIKVDYDSHQALRQQYGVTLQTTFVKIDDSGSKIASYVAYEEPQFSSVERELLK